MRLTEDDIKYITEEAVSQAQQRIMAMALQKKKHPKKKVSKKIAKIAKSMSKSDLEDFARTKHKGLPNHVDEEFNISKKNIMLTEDPAGAPADPTMAGAAAAPAGDPNAMGQAPVQTDAAAQQGTASTAVNKEKENADNITKQQAASGKAVGINPPQGDEEQQTNNTNNNQNQQQAAAQPQQAQAQQQPQQLSEADLKYISKKALSIIKEWVK